MTRKQFNRLARYNESIKLQQRTLTNLESMELVADNGKTVELTKTILRSIELAKASFVRGL